MIEKKRNAKYFLEYRDYALKIKQTVTRMCDDARVLAFGSVVNGNLLPNRSDINNLSRGVEFCSVAK